MGLQPRVTHCPGNSKSTVGETLGSFSLPQAIEQIRQQQLATRLALDVASQLVDVAGVLRLFHQRANNRCVGTPRYCCGVLLLQAQGDFSCLLKPGRDAMKPRPGT